MLMNFGDTIINLEEILYIEKQDRINNVSPQIKEYHYRIRIAFKCSGERLTLGFTEESERDKCFDYMNKECCKTSKDIYFK